MGSRGACRSSCGRGAPATAKAPLPAVAAAPQAASCFVKTTRRSAPSASPGMLRHLEGSRFETTAGTSGTKTGRLTASPQDTATGKPTRQASLGASIRRGGPGVMNNTSGGGRAAPLSADQSLLRAASVAAQPESTEVWEARPGAARAPLAGYAVASQSTRSCTPSSGNGSSRSSPRPGSARPTAVVCRRSSSATCAATSTAATAA